uniref:Uncharacterized protein n=1 Tax=Desulfobacca acetoxidans TaxID=60893 RepID=A0A7V6A4X5_9BACT
MSQDRYLHERPGRKCGAHKREGGCALPGEVSRSALRYRCPEASGRVGRSQPRAECALDSAEIRRVEVPLAPG